MWIKSLLLVLLAVLLTGCQNESLVYTHSVNQGKILETQKVNSIKLGMDKQTVEDLIGSPTLTGAFNENRWIYLATTKQHLHELSVSSRLTLVFSNNKLVKITK